MIGDWAINYAASQGAMLMRQTCLLQRVVSANDGRGGISESYVTIGIIPCTLVNKKMPPLELRSGRVASQYELMLYVSADQTIAENDRATIEGEVFRVQSVVVDHQWPIYKRCLVERLSGG